MTLCEHSSRIDELTRAIEDVKATQLAHLLYARAQAHFAADCIDKALADGHELVTLVPTSPLGYLCLGHIYETACRLSEALGYYLAGLARTVTHDTDREMLAARAERARTQLDRKVDWVQRLPVDIIALILAELSVKDCWALSQVCRHWRTTIPTGMYLASRDIRITAANRRVMAQLMDPRVQSLTLEQCAPSPHLDTCQHLRKLVIYECPINDMDEFFACLRSSGLRTLDELSVTIHPRYDLIDWEALLSHCPNLTHFTYHAPHHTLQRTGPDSVLFAPQSSSVPLKIQHLSWDVDSRGKPLEGWLSRLPDLRTLRIPYRTLANGRQSIELSALLASNPKTTHIDFHSTFHNLPAPWVDMPSLDQEDLREFHMGGLSDYTGEAIVPFLQAHQTTLRVVRIAVDASDGNRLERWSTITPLTFPVLHTLHLANMNALSPHMTSLIYRTPVLRDVVLKRIHSIRDMFLEATLQRQERLSRLTILDCPNLANNAIDRFFVKIKSRLRHVVLDTGYGLALPTLLSLAATHGETLKHVELNGDSFRGSDAGLLPFVEMLQPYGVLQHLTVGYSDALTPDTVHALADHPNLRSVAFIECHRLTDDAVRLLVDKSTSLKTIRVAHCRAVSRLTIHYARGVLGRDAVRDT